MTRRFFVYDTGKCFAVVTAEAMDAAIAKACAKTDGHEPEDCTARAAWIPHPAGGAACTDLIATHEPNVRRTPKD